LISCENIYQLTENTSLKSKYDIWVNQLNKALVLVTEWVKVQTLFEKLYLIATDKIFAENLGDYAVGMFASIIKSLESLTNIILNKKLMTLIYRSDLIDTISSCLNRLKIVKDKSKGLISNMQKSFNRFYFVSDDIVLDTISCRSIAELSSYMCYYFESIDCIIGTDIDRTEEIMKKRIAEIGRNKSEKVNRLIGHDSSIKKIPIKMGRGISAKPAIPNDNACINLPKQRMFLSTCIQDLLYNPTDDISTEGVQGIEGFGQELIIFDSNLPFGKKIDKLLSAIDLSITLHLREALIRTNSMNIDSSIPETIIQVIKSSPIQIGLIIMHMTWESEIHASLSSEREKETLKLVLDGLLSQLISYAKGKLSQYERFKVEPFIATLSFLIQYSLDNKEPVKLKYNITEQKDLMVSIENLPPSNYGWEYHGFKMANVFLSAPFVQLSYNILQAVSQKTLPILTGNSDHTIIQHIGYFYGIRCFTLNFADSVIDLEHLFKIFHGFLSTMCWLELINIQNGNNTCIEAVLDIQIGLSVEIPEQPFIFDGVSYLAADKKMFMRNGGSFSADKQISDKFRIICPIKPDLKFVSQLCLLCFGFQQPFSLSQKYHIFLKSFYLLDQIVEYSSIKIKDVLYTARSFLDQNNTKMDSECLAKALYCHFKDIIKPSYMKTFNNLICKISTNPDKLLQDLPDKLVLQEPKLIAVRHIAAKKGIILFKSLEEKSIQLLNALNSTHETNLILVGNNQSGKCTMLNLVKEVSDWIGKSSEPLVRLFPIFPNAIPFKCFLDLSNRKAILPDIFYEAIEYGNKIKSRLPDKSCSYAWIIFDGEIQTEWYEYCQWLLQKRTLFQTMVLPSTVKVIFKTTNLSNSNPLILSSNHILFLYSNQPLPENLFNAKLKFLPRCITLYEPFIMTFYKYMFASCIKIALGDVSIIIEKIYVTSMINLFASLYHEIGVDGYERFTVNEKYVWLTATLLFRYIYL
jgi:hypothetical protein